MLLGGALLTAGCHQAREPEKALPAVKVAPVSEVGVSSVREKYAGTLQPYTQTNLNFENQAYVQEVMMVPKNGSTVLVDAGDELPAGTVLARQDASEFEARAAQARASVKTSEANVSEAQAKLSQALAGQEQAFASLTQAEQNYEAALDKLSQARAQRRQAIANLAKAAAQRNEARKSFDRGNVLYHEEAMTKPDWDRTTADFESAVANTAAARAQIAEATADIGAAEAQVKTAQASIVSAQANVKSAQAQVTAAQQNVDAAQAQLAGSQANLTRAEISLSHCTLRVPTNSVLVSRSISPGTLAGPSANAFVVADMHRVKAVFGVPDVEVDKLKVGHQVRVALEAFPTELFKGKITSVSPEADSKGKIFDVQVMMDNPDLKLKSGMIASIELDHPGNKRKVLAVPLSALSRSPRNMDAYAVVVVEDQAGQKIAKFHDVKIGKTMGNLVEVEQGLAPTDQVVVSGSNLVNDGQAVQIAQ
jgi:multidrug efflux system membrane fusion protein